jgi:hypothetical protein
LQQQQQQCRQNQQANNFQNSFKPIVEMPQTPNSTMNSRGVYNLGENTMKYHQHHHHQQQQQSFQQRSASSRNGPIITQLPTPIDINNTQRYSNGSSQSTTARQFYLQQQHQQNEQFMRKAQSLTNLDPITSSFSSYQHSVKHGNLENNERHFIPIDVHNAS